MENNQDMQALLTQLEKHTRKQLLFTKILCILCVAVLLCSVVLMASVTSAANQLLQMAAPIQEMAAEAQTVMGNLETVTQALAGADLDSMVKTMNILAADSQAVVSEAMEKLDAIDIATLNKAIQDLAAVVEPMAKFSNFFG